MKRIFLYLSIPLATLVSASAQNQSSVSAVGSQIKESWSSESPYESYFSIRAGVNFSDYVDNLYYSDYQTGFNVAALYNISLMSDAPLYLQTGLGVDMKGSRNNRILEGPEPSHFKSYGLQLPVLVTFELPVGRDMAIVPELGLFYSFAFRGEMECDGEYSRPYKKETYSLASGDDVETRLLHRSDFGLRAGLSFRYMNCLIGFAYDAGLINSFTEELRDLGYSMSSGSWSVNLGYRFN